MKQKVWMLNHYATNMYFEKAGRHYNFAEKLMKLDVKTTVFCASYSHTYPEYIDVKENLFVTKKVDEIPFVFIKTTKYSKNNIKRILNMVDYYRNLMKMFKKYADEYEKPEVILASSVHPLALFAGYKIAKYFKIPFICEIRDLWPESLVAYNIISKRNPLTKFLYLGEKWIYEQADSIIMTWPGGKEYIINKKWTESIDIKKVHHISNGLDLFKFDKNKTDYNYLDEDLDNNNSFKVVYTGSIRRVNNLNILVETARDLQLSNVNIEFIIFGDGDELVGLQEKCLSEKIMNVKFKGKVDKKFIPSILSKADVNILHNSSTSLNKYGQSQNKLFEYLAAGKPILQTYKTGYSIIDNNNCGVSVSSQKPEVIGIELLKMTRDEEKCFEMGQNARDVSKKYDYLKLTNHLKKIIDEI